MPTINETLKQLEAQRNRSQKELAGLEAAINALKPLVADVPVSAPAKTVAPAAVPAKPVVVVTPAKRSKMSAAGRANVLAGVRARFARIKAEKAKAMK